MKKYYFVCCMWEKDNGKQVFNSTAIGRHPFIFIAELNKGTTYKYILISWQEITKDEFDLFHKLDAEQNV